MLLPTDLNGYLPTAVVGQTWSSVHCRGWVNLLTLSGKNNLFRQIDSELEIFLEKNRKFISAQVPELILLL